MQIQSIGKPALPPEAIGDYRVVAALSSTAFRALGPGDKHVILKLLEKDCLQRGQLHPGVHARLSRVRELAHPGVANLHSVERDIPYLFAVWDDIDGLPIDRYITANKPSPAAVGRLAREVILIVESLHALGIVHGRIHANNVLVDPRGNIRLTHISPLLYDDPAIDDAATIDLLGRLIDVAGERETPLGRSIGLAIEQKLPLRTIATRLSVSVDTAAAMDETQTVDTDSGIRWSTVGLALAIALLGAAIAWAVVHWLPR